MNHVWQRLRATAIIVGAAVALALTGCITGEATVGIISVVGGFWFGQFVPAPQ